MSQVFFFFCSVQNHVTKPRITNEERETFQLFCFQNPSLKAPEKHSRSGLKTILFAHIGKIKICWRKFEVQLQALGKSAIDTNFRGAG